MLKVPTVPDVNVVVAMAPETVATAGEKLPPPPCEVKLTVLALCELSGKVTVTVTSVEMLLDVALMAICTGTATMALIWALRLAMVLLSETMVPSRVAIVVLAMASDDVNDAT